MKKFLWRIALPVIAVALAITSASGPMTSSAIATSGGASFIRPGIERVKNYNVAIDGDHVIVNWMTNRFMDGKVLITSPYSNEVVYERGGDKTYHTVAFDLWPDTYTIQAVSTYIFQTFKIPEQEIVIEEDINVYIPEVDYVEQVNPGVEFKDHLLQEQIEELIELYFKPAEDWTLTDRANWAYAVKMII